VSIKRRDFITLLGTGSACGWTSGAGGASDLRGRGVLAGLLRTAVGAVERAESRLSAGKAREVSIGVSLALRAQ
jgi:hypothetical protein